MKIQIISDLHQEFGMNELNFDSSDLIILAGDVHIGVKGIEWILNTIKDKPVVYVLGNHEYYKGSYPKTLRKIQAMSENTNVQVLENGNFNYKDVGFHGCTLWTDFALYGDSKYYGILCQDKMNDYKQIRKDPSYSKLKSIDTYQIHKSSVKWLEKSLDNSSTTYSIVITHHAPSVKSLPSHFQKDPISCAYASNLENLIYKYQPNYWIHGHIHTPTRYNIGKTEIICNPHGYIDEKYNGYEKELIIQM